MSYEEPLGPMLIIKHTGQEFPLVEETITIGSADDNLLILTDPQVSAHHALISWQAPSGLFIIEDLGSAEGTYVNERQVRAPQPLRHGDVIRLGNTIMDARLESAMGTGVPPDAEETASPFTGPLLAGILIALSAGLTIVCIVVLATLLLGGNKGIPDVTIQSPSDGAQLAVGNEIILQAMTSGAKDITLLELSVDGLVVDSISSSNPRGTSSLTASTAWVFDAPGEHVVTAQAFTANEKVSDPASVKVSVVSAISQETPLAPASPTPTTEPGQPTDTPEPTATSTLTPQPEDTATPTAQTPPQIEYFQASPASISAGQCTTLQWGVVSNATQANIEPGIGGIPTPGSQSVCPAETTTYILTAKGPGGTSQASATVTVVGGLPDLIIDSIQFIPQPPVAGQDTQVRITIRNTGVGAAGAFNWEWTAGSDAYFNGRVFGLGAGETTVATVIWRPASANPSLTTEASVDTDDEVIESGKDNNQLTAVVQVVEGPSQPETVTIRSDEALDGYWTSDGNGSTSQDIVVGNGEISDTGSEVVARGFMSFDLTGIPAGADIENVQLRFYQKEITGAPYDKLGNLVLEFVVYGPSLSDSAFYVSAQGSATIAKQTSPGAWYTLSDSTITNWLSNAVAGGLPRFQLRLRFTQEVDGDGQEDWIAIAPGGGVLGSGNAPQLIVTFVP